MANVASQHRDQQQKAGSQIPRGKSSHGQVLSWLTPARVFELLLALRLLNALTTRTFFQPDEYYQALEPAWNAAFGSQSYAWITWEWHQHLRSSLHPGLFALAYRTVHIIGNWLNVTSTTRTELLLVTPKVVQAIIAAIGDLYTWKLARRVYGAGSGPAFAALALTVLNPWQWFCSTRTFSNGLETTITVVALCSWPFSTKDLSLPRGTTEESNRQQSRNSTEPNARNDTLSSLKAALFLAALATLLRPTNIIIWATLTLYTFFPDGSQTETTPGKTASKNASSSSSRTWPSLSAVYIFGKEAVTCGLFALIESSARDYFFYGQATFPPLNFLVFNVVMSLAVFYGNNDWHYYLSQGYPLLLTTALPFTLVGMYKILASVSRPQQSSSSERTILQGLCLISLTLPASLSVLSHKEVRFIYPLLPAFHVLAASPVCDFFGPLFASPSGSVRSTSSSNLLKRVILMVLLLLNAIIAIYTSQIHNSGLLSIPKYLQKEYESHYSIESDQIITGVSSSHIGSLSQPMTVAFLMPCHSVPWRSHLQYPPSTDQPGIKAWALTCEPPLHVSDPLLKARYRDEADLFYDDPSGWVRMNMARSRPEGIIDNRGTQARRDAGVYIDPTIQQNTHKKLSGKKSELNQHGPDVTELLPYLATRPLSSPKPQRDGNSAATTTTAGFDGGGDDLDMLSQTGTAPSSAHHIRRPWPHYLVFFEHLEPTMTSILRGSGYHECWRKFNSHWHDDWRRTGDVVVWCLRPMDIREKVSSGSEHEKTVSTEKKKMQGESRAARGSKDRDSSGQRALHMLNHNQNQV